MMFLAHVSSLIFSFLFLCFHLHGYHSTQLSLPLGSLLCSSRIRFSRVKSIFFLYQALFFQDGSMAELQPKAEDFIWWNLECGCASNQFWYLFCQEWAPSLGPWPLSWVVAVPLPHALSRAGWLLRLSLQGPSRTGTCLNHSLLSGSWHSS